MTRQRCPLHIREHIKLHLIVKREEVFQDNAEYHDKLVLSVNVLSYNDNAYKEVYVFSSAKIQLLFCSVKFSREKLTQS